MEKEFYIFQDLNLVNLKKSSDGAYNFELKLGFAVLFCLWLFITSMFWFSL